jgi:branched-chain amino acid transport system permease protein
MGISGIAPLGIGRFTITSDRALLVWLIAIAALGVTAAAAIRHSRLGRAFVAIAGSEDAARALGIDVARYKLVAFLISAFYAALAGSLFVHAVGFVSPEVYGLHMVVLAFTMLYVGGIGTVAGAALGAIVVALLPETVRRFSEYQDLAYGGVLILILIFAPGGLASLSRLWSPKDVPLIPAQAGIQGKELGPREFIPGGDGDERNESDSTQPELASGSKKEDA